MAKVFRLLITVSIVLFLATLLLVYAFLPDPSGLIFNAKGDIIYSASRNSIFFSGLFLFVIIQTTGIAYDKNVINKKNSAPWQKFFIWFYGMRLSINLFMILLLAFIGLANNAVDYSFGSIQYLAYLGPAMVIGWLCVLPFFLFLKERQ